MLQKQILRSFAMGFILLVFAADMPGWAQARGIQLEKVWEKNVYSSVLRAPLIGAVSKNGTLLLAMSQGREAVIFAADGNKLAPLRADQGGNSQMVSITDVGYDPWADGFWVWSKLSGKLSRWDIQGKHLGTSSVDQSVMFPGFHDKRRIYLRRPDQGSPWCLFSYEPAFDEELLIWQPANASTQNQGQMFSRPYVLGKERLAIADQANLVMVHLEAFEDDWQLPLPKHWTQPKTKPSGDLSIQKSSQRGVKVGILGGIDDQFWLFRRSPKLGYEFALYDGEKGVLRQTGRLEDFPLTVDSQHLYFVDVQSANELMLRKVRMRFQPE